MFKIHFFLIYLRNQKDALKLRIKTILLSYLQLRGFRY